MSKETLKLQEDISVCLASAKYPYDGNANRHLPNGEIKSAQEVFDSLSEDEKNSRRIEASAVIDFMAGFGVQEVIALAFQDYIDQK